MLTQYCENSTFGVIITGSGGVETGQSKWTRIDNSESSRFHFRITVAVLHRSVKYNLCRRSSADRWL